MRSLPLSGESGRLATSPGFGEAGVDASCATSAIARLQALAKYNTFRNPFVSDPLHSVDGSVTEDSRFPPPTLGKRRHRGLARRSPSKDALAQNRAAKG
jgi:hypothetical protein